MDSNDSFSLVLEPGELGYTGLPRPAGPPPAGPHLPPAHLPYPEQYDPAGVIPHHPPFNTCGKARRKADA